MWEQAIYYEQPLNELMRVCLRLEHLFKQVKQVLNGESKWHAKATLRIFSECLAVVDRPDLKPRIIKEFHRYLETLQRWQASPDIDRARLAELIEQTKLIINTLQQANQRLVDPLLDNSFISHIRQNIAVPAGDCSFSMPQLHYWLHHSADKRIEDCHYWWSGFALLRSVIDFMMQVVRSTSEFNKYEAREGTFQASLDANLPSQICSVMIPAALTVYPDISVGRHGLNIRFLTPRDGAKPMPVQEVIPFKLSVCVI